MDLLDLYSASSAGLVFPSESVPINYDYAESDFDHEFNFMEQISSSPLFSLIHEDEDDDNYDDNSNNNNNNNGGADFEFPIELLLSMSTTESESTESFSSHPPSYYYSSSINNNNNNNNIITNIDDDNMNNNNIPRSPSRSVSEKMMIALSLFEEDASGSLAQVWVPIKRGGGNDYVLSTWEEPYLVDPNHEILAGYRQLSRLFTFSSQMKAAAGSCFRPGLPGRVFSSKLPEWCSNVLYYTKDEYLRVEHAVAHQVRGSMALPVFEDDDDIDDDCAAAAVLELVTVDERLDFHLDMEKLCHSLQAVNLKSVSAPPRSHPQCLSRNQRAALAEITDVLRAVCHAHDLPLALTWLPCRRRRRSSSSRRDRGGGCLEEEEEPNLQNQHCPNLLCIEETACYVQDREMAGFLDACEQRGYVEEGQATIRLSITLASLASTPLLHSG